MRAADRSADIPENAAYWRRLGDVKSRNLAEVDHRRMVEESTKAAQLDGMAKAHVRLTQSITVGSQEVGPEVSCKDTAARERLQGLLNLVWNDPVNQLGSRLPALMAGLTTTGSLALTFHSSPASGMTRIGYLDPAEFVMPGLYHDPGNCFDPIALLRADPFSDGAVIAHPVLRPDSSVHPMMATRVEGDVVTLPKVGRMVSPIKATIGAPCVYVGINVVAPNQTLGISDLYAGLDIMAMCDELVFKSADRSLNIGTWSTHWKFPIGTKETDIEAQMQRIRQDVESGNGRAVGTTKDVECSVVAANLQSGEWSGMEKMVRQCALMGLGPWPVHMFSEGAATNVTTAAEQGSPVANFLLGRQGELRRTLVNACLHMVRQFPEGRALLEANPDVAIVLPLPVIVAKDTTREANVLSVETNALQAARDAGLITTAAAQREWRDGANRYGMHFKPEDSPDPEEFDEARKNTLTLPPLRVDAPSEREADPDQTTSAGTPAAAA